MKHTKKLWAGLLAGALCLSLAACGAGKSTASADGKAKQNGFAYMTDMAPGAVFDSAMPREEAKFEVADTAGSTVYRSQSVKLIRRANLTVQTTEFEKAVAALEQLVLTLGGYYENAEVRGGSYYNQNSSRSGNYTIRIPAEKYDAFMTQVDGIGYLARKNESSEDVGEIYYDTETRLKTQRTKQERLLELLGQAKSMEDIIALENALTDVEYFIEQYTSDLKRYDGLVEPTIHLALDEMVKIVDEPGEKAGLFARMKAGVVSSATGLVDGAQDALVWFSYNLFGVLIFAAAVTAGVVLGRRHIKKKKTVKKEEKTEE